MSYNKLVSYLGATGNDSFNLGDIKDAINEIEKARKEEESKFIKGETISFGKYRGKSIMEVYNFDPQYLKWLLTQPFFQNYGDLYESAKKILN